MVEKVFVDSIYRFTDPVRYFTANDPYFYQVDNIPLKQLQENDNFLKDQIENLILSGSDVSRSTFTELKPYVDGTNNVVKVKPGRFIGRVNDALYATDFFLQLMRRVFGSEEEYTSWNAGTNIEPYVLGILNKFKSNLASNMLGMNGLAERAFTYGMLDNDLTTPYNSTTQPQYNNDPIAAPWPGVTGKLWEGGTSNILKNVTKNGGGSIGFLSLGDAEIEWIRRWRGIARNAVVDVQEELSIEIPSFDANDFYYLDESGNKVLVDSSQRIDLVFIYTKPIDVSSTTISKFTGNTPSKITKPILGLVKGAGIGVNFNRTTGAVANQTTQRNYALTDENGNQIMLPNAADQNAEFLGIGDIKGSFPAPDDLMNLSPQLADTISEAYYSLIGQSVLPVAYVVVRSSAETNINGVGVITASDLIDIRPFFRTAELSYNERSGLAAATPQVSLANPVASESYVDQIEKSLITRINSRTTPTGTLNLVPRLVGCGYIKGGFNYGVESTLGHIISKKFNIPETATAQLKQQVATRFGFPTGTTIPDNPDWDIAEWCKLGDFESRGVYPNDYINYHNYGRNFNTQNGLDFGAWKEYTKSLRITELGTEEDGSPPTKGYSVIYFVKKTIQIDRSQIQWANDYHVDAQFFNCLPLTCRSKPRGDQLDGAGGAAIWIDKRESEFTIYVSWVARDNLSLPSLGSPDTQRDEGGLYAGFSVINQDTLSYPYAQRLIAGETAAGVAIYPTVTFQIFGIPNGYGSAINLQGERPIINLA